MRTDVKIDNRKVICRNSSGIGFSKHFCKSGDAVTFRLDPDSDRVYSGRSLGRLTDLANGKVYILVMTLSERLDSVYERWVDPDLVVTVTPFPADFLKWFSRKRIPYDPDMIRRLMEYGTVNDRYIGQVSERAAQLSDLRDRQSAGWTPREITTP